MRWPFCQVLHLLLRLHLKDHKNISNVKKIDFQKSIAKGMNDAVTQSLRTQSFNTVAPNFLIFISIYETYQIDRLEQRLAKAI